MRWATGFLSFLCGFSFLLGCAPRSTSFVSPSPSTLRAPDHDAAATESYTTTIPAALLDERGTGALWLKLDEPFPAGKGRRFLIASDTLELILDSRETFVFILLHVVGAMNGDGPDGQPTLYWLAAAMTHLNADQWYHMAWTWDVDQAERNGLFVDGVRQVLGVPYKYTGQIQAAGRDVDCRIGMAGAAVSALRIYEDALSEAQLAHLCRAAGHRGYTNEGLQFTGEKFVPQDVDRAHPVYETTFDDPSELVNWHLEGGRRMGIEAGKLVLQNGPPDGKGRHLVCWLKMEMPADFLLEFEVNVADRQRGLNIVFFNARGTGGQNIFDPSLATRDGAFKQYINGDIDSYHVSYWAAGRGSANIRKNGGFYLTAVGKDLIADGEPGSYQTVCVHKHGGMIRVTVDDVLAAAFNDDGRRYGPVHDHPGWIGLRQMGHTGWAKYDALRVYPLKP